MTLIGLALAFVLVGSRRVPRLIRRRMARPDIDVLVVARLLALSLASGRPLGRALADVRQRLHKHEMPVIDDVLIRANRDGLTRALVETTGPLAPLAERLAKAQVTGAPVGPALDAFIATLHDARRFQAVEEARTIGVKLIVPLTLLLLPGFLALVVAPYVLQQLEELVGAVVP
jgi:tight adherence protein B